MCAKNSYYTHASLKYLEFVGKLTIYVFEEWVMDVVLTIRLCAPRDSKQLAHLLGAPKLEFLVILLLRVLSLCHH